MSIVEPTKLAFELIEGTAPERKDCLEAFWAKYSICFEEISDRKGIVLNADKNRVQFARKDLQVMWYLGFSLWKSIALFSPSVVLPVLTNATTGPIFLLDEDLDEMEMYYRQCMGAVGELIDKSKVESERFPEEIPEPVESRTDLRNSQDIAVFDLVMMAIGVLFLHELKHVEFHAQHAEGIKRPRVLAEEELQCDVWARDWIMSGLGGYAERSGWNYQEVCSKRAAALLLVCEYLRLAERHAGAITSGEYPPLEVRIAALSGAIGLPEYDKFWVFSACVLLAECRRQGKRHSEVTGMSPRVLTESLIEALSV